MRKILVSAAIAFGLVMLLNNIMAWEDKSGGNAVDFAGLYIGGVLFRENRVELYNYKRQVETLRRIVAPKPLTNERIYLSPPFFAPLLTPFSFLSFSTAYSVQIVLNLGLLFLTLHFLTRRLDLGSLTKWLYLATFGFLPVYQAMLQGQTTFLFLLLLCLHVLDLDKGRSGLCAGLCLFKVHLAVIPLLLLAWRRSIAAIAYASLTALFLGVVSVALVGIEGMMDWINIVRMIGDFQEPFWMVNLRSLTYFLFPAEWQTRVLVIVGSLLLITLFLLHGNPKEQAMTWEATVITMLLLSPHTFIYELTLLILPFALTLSAYKEIGINRVLGTVVAINATPFIAAAPKSVWQINFPLMPIVLLWLWGRCVMDWVRGG